MGIFTSVFMQRAFAAGLMIAVIMPCIGTIAVTKRLSMIGESLSHTSLAGIAAGLLLDVNPILGAAAACIAAALCIEAVRKKFPAFSDMSIAVITSAGLGLAAVLSGFVRTSKNFESFIFGSIVLISSEELIITAVISAVVICTFLFLHREFFYIVFDERAARLSGVRVNTVNFIFTVLTAVSVSAAARIVGALIVSSLMVLPVACALQLNKSFKKTFFFSIFFSVVFTLSGIFLSYCLSLRPGGAISLSGIIVFLMLMLYNKNKIRILRLYNKLKTKISMSYNKIKSGARR
jgi:zinc transport system permease protein